jgi:hypothetical protein
MIPLGPKVPQLIEFTIRAVSRSDGSVLLQPQVGDPVECKSNEECLAALARMTGPLRARGKIVILRVGWVDEEQPS